MPLDPQITGILWDRVHLALSVTVTGVDDDAAVTASALGGSLEFVLAEGGRRMPLSARHEGDGRYRIAINITSFGGRRQLPDGTWRVVPVLAGVRLPAAGIDLTSATRLDDSSRVFLYDGNRTAYTVSFDISEDDVRPEFLMRSYQLFRPARRKKRTLRSRMLAWPRRFTSRKFKTKQLKRFYRIVRRVAPPSGNRILFASEQRISIEGNLLRIRDRMVQRGLADSYELSYSFRTPATSDKRSTLRAVYLLARADRVFIDDYFPLFDSLNLDPATVVVQVWHAGSGFKAVGYSRFGRYGSPKLSNAHRKYTYAITGSRHLVPVYAEAFGIEETAVIPTGLPRIDDFLDPERTADVVAAFFESYPDLKGKRLILFAPTFRGRGIRDAYYPYDRLDMRALYELCGDDAVMLFRMHHFIREPVPIPPEYADRLRDFSAFPSGNDLLQVVDLLITDYSSIIYEYSLLERPMLFYAFDQDIYSATRGFHRDYVETAPGKVCRTFPALLEAIREDDFEQWRREVFVDENFDYTDTGSADRVIDWLVVGDPPSDDEAAQEGSEEA